MLYEFVYKGCRIELRKNVLRVCFVNHVHLIFDLHSYGKQKITNGTNPGHLGETIINHITVWANGFPGVVM